jgi:hypothetical protein
MAIINRIERHGWCSDILSPYENISKNFNASRRYESVHSQNVSIYYKNKKKAIRFGVMSGEDKVNEYYYMFHDKRGVDSEF